MVTAAARGLLFLLRQAALATDDNGGHGSGGGHGDGHGDGHGGGHGGHVGKGGDGRGGPYEAYGANETKEVSSPQEGPHAPSRG